MAVFSIWVVLYFELLQFCLPQAVEVAVLVDRNRLATAGADNCLWLILEVYADATILSLNIDKCDVVLWEHWVCYAAHLDLNCALVNFCHYRDVLLTARLDGIWNKLLHLLAAAYYWDR